MDYTAFLAIIALIVSVITLLLLMLEKGIGMGLEFRESEATANKRKEILVALNKEIDQDIINFFVTHQEQYGTRKVDQIDDKLKNSIDELSHKHNRVSLGNDLLVSITALFNMFLKGLIATVLMISLTVFFLYAEYPSMNQFAYFVFGLVFVLLTFYVGRIAYVNLKWYMTTRSAFLNLSESPTLINAEKIINELNDKEVPKIVETA